MLYKKRFSNWLISNTHLSSNTSEKYAGAINTISKGLMKYELLEQSLYSIKDPIILETLIIKYFSIPEFIDKDIRGNRMYSNALKQYKNYISNCIE